VIEATSSRSPAIGRPWLGYLAGGFVVVAGYYLTSGQGDGRILRVVLYCLVSTSAAVAVGYGVARNKPRPLLPWLLLGLSQLVYAAADATFYIAHYVFDQTGYPSAADVLYLAHYPLVLAGLALFIRQRTPGHDRPGLLDAAVLAVAAGMVSYLFIIVPQASAESAALVKAASVAYPVMDLAMLAVALRLILGPGRRPASFFLLIANLFAIFGADTIYVLQQIHQDYVVGNFLDAVWLTGNLALGAAALHPTMARLGERAPVRNASLGPARMAVLLAAVLIAPAILLVQDARGAYDGIPVAAVACAVLFGLTIARMAGLVTDQRRLAITDGLTGLHTRRFLEEQLALEEARARRSGTLIALFIVDVDHFKSINDRYGHPAGDLALIEIAARLREVTRPGDVLARYGGEEFALLVPGASADELSGLAERLRNQVASSPITVRADTYVAVTISVGSASFPLHGEDPAELVAAADRALYRAKAEGRNRAVIGESRAPTPFLIGLAEEHGAMVDFLRHVADEVDARLSVHEHSRAVGRWSLLLSGELGHDEATSARVELAGRLHDIGKVVLPDGILTKPGALTDEEWRLLRQHPDHGSRLALLVPGFGAVAEIIRQHHERYDGTGYPDRRGGTDIRVESRILAVCDSWAAMRSDRVYQPSLSEDRAREQLRLGRGTQFDPDLVDLFLGLHEHGRLGELHVVGSEASQDAWSARVFQNVSS
jgi:two-component system cell cycle response regulator